MNKKNDKMIQEILDICNINVKDKILNRDDIFLIGIFNPLEKQFGIRITKENPIKFKNHFGEHFRLEKQTSLINSFDVRQYFYSKNQLMDQDIYFYEINEFITFKETILIFIMIGLSE